MRTLVTSGGGPKVCAALAAANATIITHNTVLSAGRGKDSLTGSLQETYHLRRSGEKGIKDASDLRPWTLDLGPWTLDLGLRRRLGPTSEVRGLRSEVHLRLPAETRIPQSRQRRPVCRRLSHLRRAPRGLCIAPGCFR